MILSSKELAEKVKKIGQELKQDVFDSVAASPNMKQSFRREAETLISVANAMQINGRYFETLS